MRLADSYGSRWSCLNSAPEVDLNELESRFALAEAQAKNYAYGEAERIKQSQETDEMRSLSARPTTPNSAGSDHAERR